MGEDKLWADIGGRPLIALTLGGVAAAGCFDHVVVVAPAARHGSILELAAEAGLDRVRCVEGGVRRQDSVAAGLAACDEAELVCVHDAARPRAAPALFQTVVAAAREEGAAITAVACVDTIKQVSRHHVVATLEREKLVAVQTPQAFRFAVLQRAHQRAAADGVSADDDAALVERMGLLVAVVPGDVRNFKVTTPFDLAVLRCGAVEMGP
jgi:2-C-methyl-D-erythritol 4-phosphate cytidylyltransferase